MSTERISTRYLYDSVSASISARSQRLLKLQVSLADGRSLHVPSDDPVRGQRAMLYREQIRATTQYERSLQAVNSVLSATEKSLGSLSDVLAHGREIQVRGANDVMEGDARLAYAAQVDQDLELLFDLANERYAGTYSFAGQHTLDPPYLAERDADGRITRVTADPRGIEGKQQRQVGPDSLITVNVLGTDLFGENEEAFAALIDLRSALEADDSDQIRSTSAALDAAVDRVARAGSAHGAVMQRVETLLAKAGRDLTTYEDGRSRSEDLDMARAVVDLQQEQLAMQSALQAGANILNMSLLDYLS